MYDFEFDGRGLLQSLVLTWRGCIAQTAGWHAPQIFSLRLIVKHSGGLVVSSKRSVLKDSLLLGLCGWGGGGRFAC